MKEIIYNNGLYEVYENEYTISYYKSKYDAEKYNEILWHCRDPKKEKRELRRKKLERIFNS